MHHRLNWRSAAFGLLAVALVAATAAATPATYQFRVYDPANQPVTDIVLYDVNATPAPMSAGLGGIFEIQGEPLDRFLVTAKADTIRLASGLKSPLVLPDSNGTLIDVHLVAPGGAPGGNVAGVDCENATVIAALPYNDTSSTLGTNSPLPGSACDGANNWGGPVGWYKVDGTGNTMTAETCNGSGQDTTLSVWLSCGANGCDNLECVAGGEDDCGPIGFSSRAVWASVEDQEYVIAVQGFGGSNTTFTLDVTDDGEEASGQILCTGGCCTCLNAPFNCQIENSPQCSALGGQYEGDGSGCCTPTGVLSEYDYAGLPVAVPGASTTLVTTTVSDGGLVGDVKLQIDLNHAFIGANQMNLLHNGANEDIWDNRCGSWDNMFATADADGTETFCTVVGAGPSETVHYSQLIASFGNLDNYACSPLDGDWTLSIADTFGPGGGGTLQALQLEVETATANCEPFAGGECEDGKALICHIPGGNPDNSHVISIGQPAVPSHMANHGDCDPPAGAVKGDPCSC